MVLCYSKKVAKEHFKDWLQGHFKAFFMESFKMHLKKHPPKKYFEEYFTKSLKFNFKDGVIRRVFQGTLH